MDTQNSSMLFDRQVINPVAEQTPPPPIRRPETPKTPAPPPPPAPTTPNPPAHPQKESPPPPIKR
jgi:hypothetical protein